MSAFSAAPDGEVRIAVKAVPGSRKTQVAGLLGDRLKLKVAAPPEDGKANQAICDLLATALGIREKDVRIVSGHASSEKVVAVFGVSLEHARRTLDVTSREKK